MHADPKGPVANAICALSSLHYVRARIAKGLEPADTNPDETVAKTYYENARWQLGNARNLQGQYSDTDAIAAILLVRYTLLTGGNRNWQVELEVACVTSDEACRCIIVRAGEASAQLHQARSRQCAQ